ncbi:CRISPR-associated endonuclease Cas1 [candidate division KSB1 bacterium]|nr:CRISPR-associated endonuclease Cas1 [candidate division KSB1 bacterium]
MMMVQNGYWSSDMSALYVTEPGAVIRLSSRTLIISKGKEKLAQVPLLRIDNVLVFGNAQITTQALSVLLAEGIDVTYLTRNGRLRGRLTSVSSKNVLLRIAQYERYLDDVFQLQLAKIFVTAKIRNCKRLIQRFGLNHPEIEMQKTIDSLIKLQHKIRSADSTANLLGLEGGASAAYFGMFGEMFVRDLKFEKRSKRPPKDPVNALLSFGYSLITNELHALIVGHGFDPYIGFLHGLSYGRPSLALDLVEEFRQPVVDRFTLRLLNRGIIKKADFINKDGGVYLTDEARKIYFTQYDKLINKKSGQPARSIRDHFKHQIRQLSKAIQKNSIYKPFKYN